MLVRVFVTGPLSWRWEACEANEECKTMVYADSLSAVSSQTYRFSDNPDYVSAYREGIARIGTIECDILLAPHPSHAAMIERAATGTLEGGMSCANYAHAKMDALERRLASEAEGGE